MILIASTLVLLFVHGGLAHKMCNADSACSDLGTGLICLMGECNVGVCSCPKNTRMVWMGSNDLFKCVPVKRVGETCDPNNGEGVCGAGYCDVETKKCTCHSIYTTDEDISDDLEGSPMANGEYCGHEHQQGAFDSSALGTVGTTCSNDGQCSFGSCLTNEATTYFDQRTALLNLYLKQCACGPHQQTIFEWSDMIGGGFAGGRVPMCGQILWGDRCLSDRDCAGNRMECGEANAGDPKTCICSTAGHKPNYERNDCGEGFPYGTIMQGGNDATGTNQPQTAAVGTSFTNGNNPVCDGTQGLIECKGTDWCETDTDVLAFNGYRTCCCGPQHIDNAGTCTLRGAGDACFGDANCKGWPTDLNPMLCISTDGTKTCQSGAAQLVTSVFLLVAAIIAAFYA